MDRNSLRAILHKLRASPSPPGESLAILPEPAGKRLILSVLLRWEEIVRIERSNWLCIVQGAVICGLALFAYPARGQQPVGRVPAGTETSPDNLPDAPVAQSDSPRSSGARHLSFGERFHLYEHTFIEPQSVIAPALGAAIDQGLNSPKEWGQGAAGFGTRFGSNYGREVIARTIRFGVAATDHEDPRYVPSNRSGFGPRVKWAVLRTYFTSTDSGTPIPAFSRFAGAYGAAFISNAWYPKSQADAPHAVERGSVSLATSAGWNVFREFWPDLRNKLHHRE